MVDSFVGKEPNAIECFGDELFLAPVDIPVFLFSLLIPSFSQARRDAVSKKSLELNIRTMISLEVPVDWKVIFLYIFSKVLRHAIILI